MAIYFRLANLAKLGTESSIIWVCFALIILTIVHWGYCATSQQVIAKYDNDNYNSKGDINSFKALFNSITAYFALTGIIQFALSLLILLLVYEVLGQNYGQRWAVLLLVLLLLTLMFNFGVVVIGGMEANFFIRYNTLPYYYGNFEFELYTKFQVFFSYSIIEAVLSLLLATPLLLYLLVMTLELSPSIKTNLDETTNRVDQSQEIQDGRGNRVASRGMSPETVRDKYQVAQDQGLGKTKIDVD